MTSKPHHPNIQIKPGELKLCYNYGSADGICRKPNCEYLHVCRTWLAGHCSKKGCNLSHSFMTAQNQKILNNHKIFLSCNEHIRVNVRKCFLKICTGYNYRKEGCKFGKNCNNLHLCYKLIYGNCNKDVCNKNHDFHAENCEKLFKRYHVDVKGQHRYIINCILVTSSSEKNMSNEVCNCQYGAASAVQAEDTVPKRIDSLNTSKPKKKHPHHRHANKARLKAAQSVENISTSLSLLNSESGSEDESECVKFNPEYSRFLEMQLKHQKSLGYFSGIQSVHSSVTVPKELMSFPTYPPTNTVPKVIDEHSRKTKKSGGKQRGRDHGNIIQEHGNMLGKKFHSTENLNVFGMKQSGNDKKELNIDPNNLASVNVLLPEKNNEIDKAYINVITGYLLKNGGTVKLECLMKENATEGFPSGFGFKRWIKIHPEKFIYKAPVAGMPECVSLRLHIRICHKYNSDSGCLEEECEYLHVCKGYIADSCHKCELAHDFQDGHLRKLLTKQDLNRLTKKDLKYLLSISLPQVCLEYNSNSVCVKRDACTKLHVCQGYIDRSCKSHEKCGLSHDLHNKHNNIVLKFHAMDKWNITILQKMILPMAYSVGSLSDSTTNIQQNDLSQQNIENVHIKLGEGAKPKTVMPQNKPTKRRPRHRKPKSFDRKLSEDSGLSSMIPDNRILQESSDNEEDSDTENTDEHVYHDSDEREVCESNLRGQCSLGCNCKDHHFHLPYMWQYCQDGRWCSFDENLIIDVEKQYGDPANEIWNGNIPVKSEYQSTPLPFYGQCEINFSEMELTGTSKAVGDVKMYEIRRVSTLQASNAKANQTFATRWRWYYQLDDGVWHGDEDSSPMTQQLEAAFNEGKPQFPFSTPDGQHFILKFDSMKLVHVEKDKGWPVRSRPVFVSKEDVEMKMKGQFQPSILKVLQMEPVKTKEPFATSLPQLADPLLDPQSPEGGIMLHPSSEEFQHAEKLFRKSMPNDKTTITKIEKIKNYSLWNTYTRKRDSIRSIFGPRRVEEKEVFYGWSCDEHLVPYIIKHNFLQNYPEQEGLLNLGGGIYFTASAEKMDKYMPRKRGYELLMFVSRIVIGQCGSGGMAESVDTVVDDIRNPSLYMVKETEQCYPEYLIHYTYDDKGDGRPVAAAPNATSEPVTASLHGNLEDVACDSFPIADDIPPTYSLPPPYSSLEFPSGGSTNAREIPKPITPPRPSRRPESFQQQPHVTQQVPSVYNVPSSISPGGDRQIASNPPYTAISGIVPLEENPHAVRGDYIQGNLPNVQHVVHHIQPRSPPAAPMAGGDPQPVSMYGNPYEPYGGRVSGQNPMAYPGTGRASGQYPMAYPGTVPSVRCSHDPQRQMSQNKDKGKDCIIQ